MNSEEESKILCREIGRLVGPIAGIGARWAARRLPDVAHESKITAHMPVTSLYELALEVLMQISKRPSEILSDQALKRASGIVGSGIQSMNPTLLLISVAASRNGSALHIRAVAKEGAVPQKSAELAIEKFMAVVSERLPNNLFKTDA